MNLQSWLTAATIAIALHVGAFYVVFQNTSDNNETAGQQGIEFDLGMMASVTTTVASVDDQSIEVPQTQDPPPEVIESIQPIIEPIVKPEPVPEPKPVTEPKPTVKPEPAVAEPEPVVEAMPIDVKQDSPIEVDKAIPASTALIEQASTPKEQTDVETQTVASENIESQPTLEAEASEQKTLPSPSNSNSAAGSSNSTSSGGNPAAKASYFSELQSVLAKNRRYPNASRRRDEEGVVRLSFIVYRDGSVSDVKIAASSGYDRLDKAVLDMIKKSTPLPKFPSDMTEEQLKIDTPVSFKLSANS